MVYGAAPAEPFRFAILGDRTGETVSGVYEQIWRDVAKTQPDFLINVGDTIQGGNDAAAAAEWAEVRPVWARIRAPFYLVPGNHDIWSEESRRVYEKATGRPASYGFNVKNAHFTVLDNSRSMQLSESQAKFLVADLEANRTRSPKFVFFHQPFWLIPMKLGATDLPFHALMKKYEVGYVVSGHVHQYSSVERDGILYLVVGSSGGHLRGHDPENAFARGWFFHHVDVRVQGTKAEMTVVETGPPFGRGRTFPVKPESN